MADDDGSGRAAFLFLDRLVAQLAARGVLSEDEWEEVIVAVLDRDRLGESQRVENWLRELQRSVYAGLDFRRQIETSKRGTPPNDDEFDP